MGRGFPAAVEQLILTAHLICLFFFNVHISYLPTLSQFHGLGVVVSLSLIVSRLSQCKQVTGTDLELFFFRQYNMSKI